jgi:hypothetical protein
MSTIYSEFAQVCQQVKHWPSDLRQHLAEEIAKSLAAELPTDNGEWNDAKNERRCELIDKDIQGTLGAAERREFELLTQEMRVHRRAVAPIPLAGAIRLHQQLLEKKWQHQQAGGETP